MGGGLSCMFSAKSSCKDDEGDWEPRYTNKIRPSDEDRGRWVGEPDVDRKASAFIAKFHETRFTDSERQAIMV